MGNDIKVTKLANFQLIALGANVPLGDVPPAQTLAHAVKALVSAGFAIRAVSRFFRTPCFPKGAGPDYVNAAVQTECEWSSAEVLTQLHQIEASFARERRERWGARTLDLDLLAMGSQVAPNVATFRKWFDLDPALQAKAAPDQMILPHPRIQDRGFVLVPLNDIAPNWRHPVLDRTTAQLLADLPTCETEEITVL